MTLGLALKLLENRGDLGAGLSVCANKIGQHYTNVAELAFGNCFKKVGERSCGNLG